MIRRLYEVEDRARPLDDAARRDLRQSEAVPILERLRDELDRLSSKLLPKSALAQAVTYALNQWQALCRYTEDGRLTIDNNVVGATAPGSSHRPHVMPSSRLCGVHGGRSPESPRSPRRSRCSRFELVRIIRDPPGRSLDPKGGHPCWTNSSADPASVTASGPTSSATWIELYVAYLDARGHPPGIIQQYVQAVEHFGAWLASEHIALEAVTRATIDSFLHDHLPRCQCPTPAPTCLYQVRAALAHLPHVPGGRLSSASSPHRPRHPVDVALEHYRRIPAGHLRPGRVHLHLSGSLRPRIPPGPSSATGPCDGRPFALRI